MAKTDMKIGMIGLGKMGGSMAEKLLKNNCTLLVYDVDEDVREDMKKLGALSSGSLEEFCRLADKESVEIIWCMLPAGKITESTILELAERCKKKKLFIDGGNSYYKESMSLGKAVEEKEHQFMDIGTSGGIWGSERGYCFMAGGNKESYEKIERFLKILAADKGYAHVGPVGAGHYVKMIHNGIEYALMQAYGEGFELLHGKNEFELNLEKISEIWQHGSVIDSWLLQLCNRIFKEGDLDGIKGYVQDSGEGRWTLEEAIEQRVSTPAIAASLFQRFRSRREETFSDKIIAGLRREFGGHDVKKTGGSR